ncbi:MAG: zinc-dependent metalloprotease [Spirosomataceae bacterium]
MKQFFTCLLVVVGTTLLAQERRFPQGTPPTTATPSSGAPTTPNATPPVRTGPRPYREVITEKARTNKGLLTVHKLDDKYFFEIPDSIMGRDIMSVTRYVRTTANGGFGGEEVNRQMIRWEKGPDNRVFMRSITIANFSPDSTKPIFQAVRNSNVDPIAASFDVKASKRDTSTVIDVTDYFKGDNQIFSLDPNVKQRYRLTALIADRSYIQSIRSFPINTEIKTVKTFGVTAPTPTFGAPSPTPGPTTVALPAGIDAGAVTIELNTSMILLPKVPMKKRIFDPRVGYFANGYTVFGENSQKTEDEIFAVRWRLEPKNAADAERQKKGELIEPKKPILFYIDPATPEKWRKYLILGINDWQVAFEQAGWKNAIIGKEWPKGDSTMSLEDARYSAIRYFAADIENAYGPNVHDPRSGEIIESHIGWYHNVMNLLHKWFFIQTAAANPAARKPKFDDELMGQLIRFVSSHEVGHTLGLRHNFGASHATPVEKLRDKDYVLKNGHTSSIMDYARFNYVAQPEDGVTDYFPRIGDYDKWAIEWAYKPVYEAKDTDEEKKILNKTVIDRIKANPRLWFGTETNPYDPRSQSECIGDNNMKASEYGIKNLQKIVPNLITWTKQEAETYADLSEMYAEVMGQFRRYMGHVTKNVGGIYETPKMYDEEGVVYEPTPKTLQKDAVAFLNKQLFETPTWLLEPNVLARITPTQGVNSVSSMQEATLNSLLAGDRLLRLIETNSRFPNTYTADELMTDLRSGIWSELKSKKAIDTYRRNLQKVFTEKLIAMLGGTMSISGFSFGAAAAPVDAKKNDIMSLVRAHATQLQAEIKAALPLTTDKMSKYHLQDCAFRLEKALNPK